MDRYIVKVSSKGQIAIPKKVRDRLNSELLEMEFRDNKITLKPAESIQSIGGSLKKYARNLKASSNKVQEDERAWEIHAKEKGRRS